MEIHFGNLMALCFLKNAELAKKFQLYKGRVVFRGDGVKDQTGDLAVFSQQQASASNMAAAKVLAVVARFKGCSAIDTDAQSAYTQAELQGPPCYITLPKEQQPKSWSKLSYNDPVCQMRVALYGHPRAQNYWEWHA